MNTLVIMLDGCADESIPALGGQTPLESLDKPFMDSIASSGEFGWTEGQKYTHLFLLGFFTGKVCEVPRGLIEACGMNVPLTDTSAAYRFSPACVKKGSYDWAYRVSQENYARLQECMIRHLSIIRDLKPHLYFHGSDGRGVITVENKCREYPMPPHPLPNKPDYEPFKEYIDAVGEELEGLTFLPWGGGSDANSNHKAAFPRTKDLTILSSSPSALGVGNLLGISCRRVDNFRTGMDECLEMIKHGDVFLHVDETDDVSHRREPEAKRDMIVEIDAFFEENIDFLEGHKIALIIDHGTSSLSGQHMPVPVPFAVAKITRDMKSGIKFCEKTEKHYPLERLFPAICDHDGL